MYLKNTALKKIAKGNVIINQIALIYAKTILEFLKKQKTASAKQKNIKNYLMEHGE